SQYSVAQEFSDKITVQIIDVMPNGNLLLGGRRQRMVAGEIRTLIVSGMVRENDIGPNNTVSSGLIANFKVAYEGDGPESSFTQQGWASRFVNKIWPF
ncbi:MAG: flagellar basal body L-ring protein FlgH, partial [Planctomycetales bacterium]|nr:flagellar basal body L-ring protein FlgH [Planctomycetales bacterium]